MSGKNIRFPSNLIPFLSWQRYYWGMCTGTQWRIEGEANVIFTYFFNFIHKNSLFTLSQWRGGVNFLSGKGWVSYSSKFPKYRSLIRIPPFPPYTRQSSLSNTFPDLLHYEIFSLCYIKKKQEFIIHYITFLFHWFIVILPMFP